MREGQANGSMEGELLAYLDGELDAERRRAVREKLDESPELAARLEELRFASRRAAAALESLDVDVPWSEVPPALREAAARAPTPLRAAAEDDGSRGTRRAVIAAAGLVLVLAAGAYAVPGSPVRDWVAHSVSTIGTLIGTEPSGPADPGPSVVAVEPEDGAVRIVIRDAAASLRLTVATTTGSRARVSARDARFHVEAGRIEVSGAAGDVRAELPRGIAEGTVELDGIVVARIEAGRLRLTPAADGTGVEIVLDPQG